jgi:hypothetical protein
MPLSDAKMLQALMALVNAIVGFVKSRHSETAGGNPKVSWVQGGKKRRRRRGVGEVRKIYEVEGGIGIGSGLGFVHYMTRDGLRLLVTELR